MQKVGKMIEKSKKRAHHYIPYVGTIDFVCLLKFSFFTPFYILAILKIFSHAF